MSRDDVQFAVCPTTLITLRCVGWQKKEDAETKSSSKHLMKPIIGVKSFFGDCERKQEISHFLELIFKKKERKERTRIVHGSGHN